MTNFTTIQHLIT